MLSIINKADSPSFFELVYQVVRLIPKGRVSTYGAIAAYLGSKQSSRAVGYALNGAHFIQPKVRRKAPAWGWRWCSVSSFNAAVKFE